MTINLRLVLTAALALASTGCFSPGKNTSPIEVMPDMDRQFKFKPQQHTELFSDGRASRKPVEGTVAIGYLKNDDGYTTGIVDNKYIGLNPEKMDKQLLLRGQERFNIYCQPCHSRTGGMLGIVGRRTQGWIPTSLQDPRVKGMADGEIFNVITNGRRSMPSYKNQIPEKDRWAIVSYVRALQRSTSGTIDDVPADLRAGLK